MCHGGSLRRPGALVSRPDGSVSRTDNMVSRPGSAMAVTAPGDRLARHATGGAVQYQLPGGPQCSFRGARTDSEDTGEYRV